MKFASINMEICGGVAQLGVRMITIQPEWYS